MRRRALTLCVPLVLCLVIGVMAWPGVMRERTDSLPAPGSSMPQPGKADQADSPAKESKPLLPYAPGADGTPDDGENQYAWVDPREATISSTGRGLETVEIEGTDEVLSLLARQEHLASQTEEENVKARASGEQIYCIVVALPQGGQRTYYLDGNVLTAETGGWQLVLDEKEEETLRQALGLPEASRGRS